MFAFWWAEARDGYIAERFPLNHSTAKYVYWDTDISQRVRSLSLICQNANYENM